METKVYAYGCKLEQRAETIQFLAYESHKLRNKLIELDRLRRDEYHRAVAMISPEYGKMLDTSRQIGEMSREQVAELDKESPGIRDLWARAKVIRQEAAANHRKAAAAILEASPEYREAKETLDTLKTIAKAKYKREVFYPLRSRKYRESGFKDFLAEADEAHEKRVAEACAESSATSGTKTQRRKEAAGLRNGAPSRFRPYTDCKIAVQIQGGVTFEDIKNGKCKLMRVEPVDTPGRAGRRQGMRNRVLLWLRGEDGEMCWVSVLAELHRPIPPCAKIKWVCLVGKKAGRSWKWQIQLTVVGELGSCVSGSGSVAVYTEPMTFENGLTVAGWSADRALAEGDARRLKEVGCVVSPCRLYGRVVLPRVTPGGKAGLVDRDKKVDGLCGLTKGLSIAAITDFVIWKENLSDAPEWFAEETKFAKNWKSPKRLTRLMARWEKDRFDGDDSGWEMLLEWRRGYFHLLPWIENQRQRVRRQRREVYRVFAAVIQRSYKDIYHHKKSLAISSGKNTGSKPKEVGKRYNRLKSVAASGELLNAIGGMEDVKGGNPSRACAQCGGTSIAGSTATIVSCDSCGNITDRWRNAADNILKLATGG